MSGRSHHRARPAFTLVELLIGLAIGAVLLLAMAASMKASVDSFTANQISADTLQRARIAMLRISQELRAGTDHLPTTSARQTSFLAGTTVTDTGISFTNDRGEAVRYTYDSNAHTLTVQINGGTARRLASHVTGFDVRMDPARSAQSIKTGGVYDELERVTVTLSLNPVVDGNEISGQPVTLSNSVTPRARLWN